MRTTGEWRSRVAADPAVMAVLADDGDNLLDRVAAISPAFATAVREALAVSATAARRRTPASTSSA